MSEFDVELITVSITLHFHIGLFFKLSFTCISILDYSSNNWNYKYSVTRQKYNYNNFHTVIPNKREAPSLQNFAFKMIKSIIKSIKPQKSFKKLRQLPYLHKKRNNTSSKAHYLSHKPASFFKNRISGYLFGSTSLV